MSKLNVSVLTLFPQLFPGPLGVSVIGRALEKQLWQLNIEDIRKFATDKYKSVDDYPAGGGVGMIFKPDVLGAAIEAAQNKLGGSKTIYLSPRGQIFNQKLAAQLLSYQNLILVCARFEGIDQRVIEHYKMEEISVGDYILAGGEVAAFAVLESCIRLIPGVLGKDHSSKEESFCTDTPYEFLLEYDQYTKPNVWNGYEIPSVLLSGNHKEISKWRLQNACERTKKYRPDLWQIHLERNGR